MKRTLSILTGLLPVLVLFGAAAPVSAFTTDLPNYRCSNRIIYIGDPERRVAERCGDPDDAFASNNSDVWVYNFQQSRFVYYFTFTNGQLQRIQQVACDEDNTYCPYFR